MKRCPTCNQTFEEEWLGFCTQDGTALIEDASKANEPRPTIVSPAPSSASPYQQNAPSGGFGAPAPQYQPPQPMQSNWTPPPPPTRSTGPQQGLALTSLILGIFSITFGICCSVGLLTAPVAIVLGIVSLVQIKNEPTKFTGKPLAITGIVAGGAYLAFWVVIVLLYGVAIFMGSLNH